MLQSPGCIELLWGPRVYEPFASPGHFFAFCWWQGGSLDLFPSPLNSRTRMLNCFFAWQISLLSGYLYFSSCSLLFTGLQSVETLLSLALWMQLRVDVFKPAGLWSEYLLSFSSSHPFLMKTLVGLSNIQTVIHKPSEMILPFPMQPIPRQGETPLLTFSLSLQHCCQKWQTQ